MANITSSVQFLDKTDPTTTSAYTAYDNKTEFLTPTNINELKTTINHNAASLDNLDSEVVKKVVVNLTLPDKVQSAGVISVNRLYWVC